MNLLNNAAHAVEARPAAERCIAVCTSFDGRHVRVAVRDNGPGMAREARDHAFDEGFTTRSNGGGTGLFMCKALVEKGGGRVALDSIPGEFTQVSVCLPGERPGENPPK
jgi:signal transduction histidine kinase